MAGIFEIKKLCILLRGGCGTLKKPPSRRAENLTTRNNFLCKKFIEFFLPTLPLPFSAIRSGGSRDGLVPVDKYFVE